MDDIIINKNHRIRIPDWIYNADKIPELSLNILISDGVKHSYNELYAIFGDLIDKPSAFTRMLNAAGAMLFEDKERSETFIMANTLTPFQERFGQCVQKVIDMYKKNDYYSYQEILNEVRDVMPSGCTIDQVLKDAKLILYLRDRPYRLAKIRLPRSLLLMRSG